MQINFGALEEAFAPIAKIGQGESTFEAAGTTITLRVLRPEEEVAVQKYATVALEAEDDSAAVDYLDRFRVALLSYSIIGVGDQDFRDVDFVFTGETTESGAPIKVSKDKAMRDLISRWTRTGLQQVFVKFHELSRKADEAAEAAVQFEPSNIPAEIDRLKARIEELQREMEKAHIIEKTQFSDKIARVATGQMPEAMVDPSPAIEISDEGSEEPKASEPSPQVMPAPRSGPISPRKAAPPVPHVAAPRVPAPEPGPPVVHSSFVDVGDDGGMDQALAAEHQRLVEMRRRAQAQQTPMDEGSALEQIHPRAAPLRRPPHLDALEVEEDLGLVPAARPRDAIGGVPVFEMPSQTLEATSPRPTTNRGTLNPNQEAGQSRNPRFQAPRKP